MAADPARRPLDPGWRERHIQGQADGSLPPGKIPLTYADGTLVLDRLGRQRWWSPEVEVATRPRPAKGWPAVAAPGAGVPAVPAERGRVGRAAREADPTADPTRAPGAKAARSRHRRGARCVIHGCDPEIAARLAVPNPNDVNVRIRLRPPDPVVRPPSSREIARRKAKAEERARAVEGAQALRAQVQRSLKPPAGRLFAVDVAALVLRGPAGGIGTSERIAKTLAPLAAGGRHPTAALIAAGAWRDDQALREALTGVGPKLAAVGLRLDRRKAGLRMAKIPAAPGPNGSITVLRCT